MHLGLLRRSRSWATDEAALGSTGSFVSLFDDLGGHAVDWQGSSSGLYFDAQGNKAARRSRSPLPQMTPMR